MAAFFQSLGKTITAGVVLLIVLLIILAGAGGKVASTAGGSSRCAGCTSRPA